MKERLERLLAERGMKSAQLAAAAGLGTSTVDDILKGKTNEQNIGVSKMLKIAEVLEVSVEWLYGRTVPDSEPPLRAAERQLLGMFRQLNEEGAEKALGYLADLVDTGKYKKHAESGMVLEA